MIRAEAVPSGLEVELYGEVGFSPWGDGMTAAQLSAAIREAEGSGPVDQIRVRVNSPGGDVFEGLAIYNLLAGHKAKVHVVVDGLAASAASFIAMAGDRITMAEGSMMMVHNAWSVVAGNADDMREKAAMLDKVDGVLAGVYAARTKQKDAKVREMMAAETWMTGSEAKALGFADEVTPNKTKPERAHAEIRMPFRNAPVERLAALGFDFVPEPTLGGHFVAARRGEKFNPYVDPGDPPAAPAPSDDAFLPDGTVRSSIRAYEQIRRKLESGEGLSPAERALAALRIREAEEQARAENLKHAPAARLDPQPQRRVGDCF